MVISHHKSSEGTHESYILLHGRHGGTHLKLKGELRENNLGYIGKNREEQSDREAHMTLAIRPTQRQHTGMIIISYSILYKTIIYMYVCSNI